MHKPNQLLSSYGLATVLACITFTLAKLGYIWTQPLQNTTIPSVTHLLPPRRNWPICSWLAVLNILPSAQVITTKQHLHITLTTDMTTWWQILNRHSTCTPDVQSIDITPIPSSMGQDLNIALTLNPGH